MIWSISGYKEFQRCQRKWFYGEKIASWKANDNFRREVYTLSNLESIDAWRGNLVDYTITTKIIPALRWKNVINKDDILKFANKLTRDRYNFAKNKTYREPGITKSSRKYDYAALFDFEYNPSVDLKDRFNKAWQDVELSLSNFIDNKDLLTRLQSAEKLLTQKSLFFKYCGYTIRGVPDLIAFYPNEPPHIFDWKVHVFGVKTYHEQLLVYAMALKRSEPQKDFPDISKFSVTDIKLSEYQLLKNVIRPYSVTEEYVLDTEELIAEGIYKMELLGANKQLNELDIDEFGTTRFPENCSTCCYKKICIGG